MSNEVQFEDSTTPPSVRRGYFLFVFGFFPCGFIVTNIFNPNETRYHFERVDKKIACNKVSANIARLTNAEYHKLKSNRDSSIYHLLFALIRHFCHVLINNETVALSKIFTHTQMVTLDGCWCFREKTTNNATYRQQRWHLLAKIYFVQVE